MPFHRIRLLFVWFLLLFSSSMVQARPAENRSTYPFNASISVSGQSVYLSDYADEFNTPVTLSITCIDPSISSIQVKLVVGIRSGGFSCKSSSYAVTTPITMSFGDRYVLSSEQVASYFKAHNLQVTGLVNGRIPEGLAEFSVEVQEYHSGTKLSAMAYTMRQLKLLSPPRLQSPTNGRRVDETKANNLLFTWSPVFVPTGQTIQYEFILKELADTLSAAQTAFNYAPVVYTEKTNLSSLIYSIDKPMLETGKKYGWCIKASIDGMGSSQAANSYFTNAGYSEIFCFTVKDTEQQNDSPVTTAEKPTEEDNPNCGVAPQIDLSNTTPIEMLQVGDTIMAGDFPVVLLEVSGSGGTFSGKGSVDIPYISKALRFAVEFDGIGVNTDKRLISGQITAVQNASLDNIANLDAIDYGATRTIEKAVTSADVSLGVALPNAPPPSIHYDQSSNKLTFYNATGGVIAETTLNNPQGGKVFPITVKDEQGNLYQIDELQNSDSTTHHTLTALGKQEGVLPYKSYNTSGIDASVAVVTFEPLDSPYSFDTFKDYYKDIPLIYKQNTLQADLRYPYMGYDYYTPWQFIPLGERVTLTAKLKINDKKAGIDPSKVIFRTEEGLVLPATYNPKNNTYTLTIPSAQSEGYYLLHALYQTGIKDYLHFGQIGIDTRKPITAKVVLVPMGGGYHASELQNQINAITEQVGLTWQVEEMSGFEVTDEVTQHLFEKESHDLFSYNDAQKALNSAFKSHLGSKYDASACYVFMFDKAPVKGDRNIIGFMPRGGQYGYVHCSKLSSEELATILAHELMHGQFLLRHTFDDKYKKDLKQGVNPDNLMDYKGGTHIAKWQWDQIYDPAITTSLIKYDEEGELSTKYELQVFTTDKEINDEDYVFISPKPEMPKIFVQPITIVNYFGKDSINSYKSIFTRKDKITIRAKIQYKRFAEGILIRNDSITIPSIGWDSIQANEAWKLDFRNQFCGGTVLIECQINDSLLTRRFYIRGKNPSKQEILNYLSQMGYNEWFLPKMIMHESKMHQFNPGKNYTPDGTIGVPNWGKPNGYGLMQLDNFGEKDKKKIYATTDELWNWKHNIDRGVKFIREDKAKWARDKMRGYIEAYNRAKHKLNGTIKYYIEDGQNAGLEVIELREGENSEYEIFAVFPNEKERCLTDAITIRYYNGGLYCVYKQDNIDKGFSPWVIRTINKDGFNYVQRICGTIID